MRVPAVTAVAIGAAVWLAAGAARADGELAMRGVYYKEKATRVVQPMLDARFDVGDAGQVDAHLLVDAITSASVASGSSGIAFSERRYEAGGGYLDRRGRWGYGASGRLSREPDYTSLFGGLRGDVALADDNFLLGVALGAGHDSISNAGAAMMMGTPLSGTMTTLLASVSASQIVSPRLVVGLTYDVSRLDGFQENPYRSVITAEGLVMERHPQTRRRQAWAASARWFVGRTATTVIASHRVYVDDWGIVAHTPELRVVQEAGDAADVAIRYRYHHQSAADFYLPSYPSADPSDFPYLTDDVKLSAFTSHTIGFKVGVFGRAFGLDGALGDARGEVEFEYVDQNNRFGNAGIANAALILPIR
ncbi:MAG: DUF3570 domain-containing protein [Kofleriaceae bacterium]|nr:DUF3570 domain-containing protein [Myxococcales bacterium]MCB9560021.1 DUF3570 domain-containing protein [Kofleriaceae bacterium]MCB9571928.1 DUF3570 domain-containing protein [Kofleriaceae bacterium]